VLALVLTRSANTDLLEIWEFIAADNRDQADPFIGLIDATFQNLSRQAGLGRRRDELAPGLRSFPVGWYEERIDGLGEQAALPARRSARP
jgi:toxin ParE1/3/4